MQASREIKETLDFLLESVSEFEAGHSSQNYWKPNAREGLESLLNEAVAITRKACEDWDVPALWQSIEVAEEIFGELLSALQEYPDIGYTHYILVSSVEFFSAVKQAIENFPEASVNLERLEVVSLRFWSLSGLVAQQLN